MKINRYRKLLFIGMFVFIVAIFLDKKIVSAVDQISEFGFTGSELEFDSKIWKETDKSGGEREMMLNDLYNYISDGDNEQKIVEILGIPDKKTKIQYQYLLSIGYDPCYLILDFENDQLVEMIRECN